MIALKYMRKIPRRSLYEARALLWRLQGRLHKTVTTRTHQGLFTVACADSVIGKALYCSREYELDLTVKVIDFLKLRHTPPRGTVLDIGANVGIISVGMLHTGLVAKAIAIEPEPYNFSLLQRNIRQNSLEAAFVCLPYAASDTAGQVRFELNANNLGDHRVRTGTAAGAAAELYRESQRQVIEVTADRLDQLLEPLSPSVTDEIALIWIDVQGYEGYVFRGGPRLFSRPIPVVAEIWPYGIQRTGMSQAEFCDIAREYWSTYWMQRKDKFIAYPIAALSSLFDEVGYDDGYTNVIFTH